MTSANPPEPQKDLDEIRKSGILRVGVPYSRTNFFMDSGRLRGFEFELFRELENQLKQTRKRGQLPTTISLQPMPVSGLIDAVADGTIDIAAGIVQTEERKQKVDFTDPYMRKVDTVVVSNSSSPHLSKVTDLSGKTVLLNNGSSYPGRMEELNRDFKKRGLKPVTIELVDILETEDILELVNSGAVPYTVVHEHRANLWKEVFPKLEIYNGLTLGEPAYFAWAIRKNSPELMETLNQFIKKNKQGTLIGNVLLKRYFKDTKWVTNPMETRERKRIQSYTSLFKKYGEKYHIDWIFLAATAYQESKLNPKLRSHAGAIGLMQVRPETAAEVGISGIEDPEKNVEAAARYFDLLRKNYLSDPELPPVHMLAMMSASYNAGPTRIHQLRREAANQNLDPSQWYGNVELVALKDIGLETVRYVANVAKYELCFSKILLTDDERERLIKRFQVSGGTY